MTLLGKAVVAIWNDILPDGRENFIEWHNREHIPERVAIPGFLRGRRYVAEQGSPEYFTLYEAADPSVLTGPAYLERLNNPTSWTRRSTADFRNTLRGICGNEYSRGSGDGGFLVTLRFDAAGESRAALSAAIIAGLDRAREQNGVTGAHLCIADAAASDMETAESKDRDVGVPNWVVLVEGSSLAAVDAARGPLSAALAADSRSGPVETGLYRLEFSLVDFPTSFAEPERKVS